MQVEYSGVHSLRIGDFINGSYSREGFVDTWEDLHLIPASRPVISPPKVRENYVDIPGAHGSTDLTDLLIGRPLYENRLGSLDFYVDNTNAEYDRWDVAYDKLLNLLHGFKKKVILTDSPSYYYEGRLSINSWKTDKTFSTISIDYNLEPFKYMLWRTIDDWEWDPFDFLHGEIPPSRSDFIKDIPYNSGSVPTIALTQGFMGTLPIIPVISIELTDQSLEGGKLGDTSYAYVTIQENSPTNTGQLVTRLTAKIDMKYASANKKIIEAALPDLAITNYFQGYSCKFEFDNHIKDASGTGANATFKLIFRPGRL